MKLVSHGELDGYRLARCEPLADAPVPAGAEAEAVEALAAQVRRERGWGEGGFTFMII